MTMRIALLLSVVTTGFLAGCAVDASPEAETTDEAVTASTIKATLHEKTLTKSVDKCSFSVKYVNVSVPSATATDALNSALSPVLADLVAEGRGCSGTFVYERTTEAVYNGRGLLSVTRSGSYLTEGAAHPSEFAGAETYNLSTGRRITLSSALTPEGVAAVESACVEAVTAELDAATAAAICPDAVSDEGDSRAAWAIAPTGLRLFAKADPRTLTDDLTSGIFVTWGALKGEIKNARLKTIAEAVRR